MLNRANVLLPERKNDPVEIQAPYRMNIPLLLLTFILICYGMIMLFSASMSRGYALERNLYIRHQSSAVDAYRYRYRDDTPVYTDSGV